MMAAMIKPRKASPISPSPRPTEPLPLADIADRVDAIDWPRISRELDDHGNAVIERLLSASEC
ncbi:MAG TPA: hypothetical protein VGG67_14280, partial [Steroidobacteraceae bacterium]